MNVVIWIMDGWLCVDQKNSTETLFQRFAYFMVWNGMQVLVLVSLSESKMVQSM